MSEEGLRNAEQMRIASEKARVHGIDPQLIWDVLGFGPPDSVDSLSTLLLARADLVEQQPAFVGFLITLMLDRCGGQQIPPPASLTRVLRVYTGADQFAANEIRAPGAFERAGWYLAIHPGASRSEIARECGVSKQAVSKWFNEGGSQKFANYIISTVSPRLLADSRDLSTKISCD